MGALGEAGIILTCVQNLLAYHIQYTVCILHMEEMGRNGNGALFFSYSTTHRSNICKCLAFFILQENQGQAGFVMLDNTNTYTAYNKQQCRNNMQLLTLSDADLPANPHQTRTKQVNVNDKMHFQTTLSAYRVYRPVCNSNISSKV